MRERILVMGVPGSGKSYQWLKIAEALRDKGVKFRCLDTDDAIPYMLETQFQHLIPNNGGNVHVHPAFDWPEYKEGLEWVLSEDTEGDWIILDMADNAWSTVQRYFITEVFSANMGDYFLNVRKSIQAMAKQPKSIMSEAMRGWLDWPVVNRLYDDWILPIVYKTKGNVYVTTKPQEITRDDEALTKLVYGPIGLRPAGQKHLGHQVHTSFLFTPGKDEWLITTAKDRAGRTYFKQTKLHSLHMQYLVAKAGWSVD